MTYEQWMTATGSRFNMSQPDIELIIINQGLDPDEEVDVTKAKQALCKEFALCIPLANVSEGGYSISWNMEAIKLWYNATCAELGITPVSKPRIRNASNRW